MNSIMAIGVAVSPRRWLYLPISIQLREFEGNALLAFEAAKRGWGVVVCRKMPREKQRWPRGVIIEKNIGPGHRFDDILEWQADGGKTVAWGEEGLVYHNAEAYGRRKLDLKTYKLLEKYFCWGQNEATDLVERLGCSRDKIKVTGNPRFDLHRS